MHSFNTVLDVREAGLQRLQAFLALLFQVFQAIIKHLKVILCGLRLDKLLVKCVKYDLSFEEGVVIVDHNLHSRLILPYVLSLKLELFEVSSHLLDSSARMHGFQIRLRIKLQTLDVDLVHADFVVVHDLG